MEWIYHYLIRKKKFKNYEKIYLKYKVYKVNVWDLWVDMLDMENIMLENLQFIHLKIQKMNLTKKNVWKFKLKDNLEYEIKLISESEVILTINNNKENIKVILIYLYPWKK